MAEDQTIKPEGAQEGAAQGEQAPGKKKKINKLSPEAITKKIEALTQANQIKSKYYQHLLQRKAERQA